MAIRWRKNDKLFCAAFSEPEEGDTYIDDRLHYKLAVELKVITSIKDGTTWKWKEGERVGKSKSL